ncbi:MAG: putative glycosyltransferase [Phycisphaerales bacterium]|nr:putative glycosyltransferase [Phycisphaerales bacterium]
MVDSPVVSVVMPVARVRTFLGEALQSVLRQSLAGLEVILVDDAPGVPGLAEIVAAAGDGRARVIPCQGRGISDALNTGFAASRGRLLCRCDADDLFPPDRLKEQVQFLEQRPEFGATCGSMWAMTPRGKFVADMNGSYRTEEITDELRRGVTRSSLCTWAVRAELLRAVGGFRRYFVTAEDIDLQLRIGERSRVWYEARMAYHYRLHDTSTTHSQPSAQRAFFDATARKFQAQRLSQGKDDLDLGHPPAPPTADTAPRDSSATTQNLLLGASWEKHRSGRKLAAMRLGLQACLARPANFAAWRSLGALTFKRAAGKAQGAPPGRPNIKPN